jgi:hypothetical protein
MIRISSTGSADINGTVGVDEMHKFCFLLEIKPAEIIVTLKYGTAINPDVFQPETQNYSHGIPEGS